jgi:hypothetical protein
MNYHSKYLKVIQDDWYCTILFQLPHYCTTTTVLLLHCSRQIWTQFFKMHFYY